MTTIHTAPSVDPDTVTDEQIAAVFAEYGIQPAAILEGFFQPGTTYRRNVERFRCAAVGTCDGKRIAFGYMPINLKGVATWETWFMTEWDWERKWEAQS